MLDIDLFTELDVKGLLFTVLDVKIVVYSARGKRIDLFTV